MKTRISITLEDSILKRLDKKVDGIDIKSRSHAVERLIRRSLRSEKIKKAVVLCGGKGTRLRPLTYEIPKPMVPLHGKPLLEHTLNYLNEEGIEEVILAVGYKAEKIISHFGSRFKNMEVKYSIEKQPMGTGGCLTLIKEELDDTFLVLNGDEFKKIDLTDMLWLHRSQNAMVTLALTTMEDVSGYGVANLKGNRIIDFVEKPKPEEAPTKLINAGAYILEPEFLKLLPKKFKNCEELFPLIAKKGLMVGYVFEGKWYDLGTWERYQKAIEEFNGGGKNV